MSEIQCIYPSRAISRLDEVITQIGQSPEPLLSSEQAEKVFAFEQELYDNNLSDKEFPLSTEHAATLEKSEQPLPTLESVWRKKIGSNSFGVGYFLTEIGVLEYEEVFGQPLQAKSSDEVEKELRSHDLSKYKAKVLDKLSGDSVGFEEQRIVGEFERRNYEDIEGIGEPQVISILKRPEILVEKAQKYRILKKYLRTVSADIRNNTAEDEEAVQAAKMFVVNQYRQRVNRFLAGLYPDAFSLLLHYRKTKDDQTAAQLEELKMSLPAFNYLNDDPKIAGFLEHIDHFRNGVSRNDEGDLTVIDPQVENFLQIADRQEANREVQRDNFADIDLEAIVNMLVDSETMRQWAAKLLEAWDLLSEYEGYDSDREERAPDGKWQAVTSEKFKSLAVNGKQAVVKIPLTEKSQRTVESVVPILAHESGHVWQSENKRRLGRLAIMQEIGLGNNSVFLEAGAKWWEREAKERLTGEVDTDISGTSYLKATKVRLQGGSFAQCMQAFFEDLRRRNPDMPLEQAAARAVNRTRRIYRSGGNFAKGTNHLTNSQPLSYLEQELVAAKMPHDQRRLLLFGGATLETLIDFRNIGLIDLESITTPSPLPWEILTQVIKEAK